MTNQLDLIEKGLGKIHVHKKHAQDQLMVIDEGQTKKKKIIFNTETENETKPSGKKLFFASDSLGPYVLTNEFQQKMSTSLNRPNKLNSSYRNVNYSTKKSNQKPYGNKHYSNEIYHGINSKSFNSKPHKKNYNANGVHHNNLKKYHNYNFQHHSGKKNNRYRGSRGGQFVQNKKKIEKLGILFGGFMNMVNYI